jgi:hypothetical protein
MADVQSILQSWSAPLGVDLALSVTLLVYARGWFRLRSVIPNLISLWRFAAFIAGIVFVWIAIGSRLNAFDDALLTVHMVQHLLLMSIAPPLILLGAPQLPLLHGLPRSFACSVVSPILRSSPVKRAGHLIANPAFCWLASPHRVACPRGIPTGATLEPVARNRACVLPGCWPSILVAGDSTVAECCALATLVDTVVPVLCDVAV